VMVTNRVAAGNGARYANVFALLTTKAVYEGQRAASDQKRVSFSPVSVAGSQRNAVTAWSATSIRIGETLRRQGPAGLNYSLRTALWTTDLAASLPEIPTIPAYAPALHPAGPVRHFLPHLPASTAPR